MLVFRKSANYNSIIEENKKQCRKKFLYIRQLYTFGGKIVLNEILREFLDNDLEHITEIIKDYPAQIPVPVVAELIGTSPTNLRKCIEQNKPDFICLSWQNDGKSNKGYAIATVPFIRKWLNIN